MTPKERAAMQQALEALEICNANVYVKGTEAITALREALAEQAEQEPKYWTYVVNGTWRNIDSTEPPDDAYDEGTLEPLYAAPVQQAEQWPVAWLAQDDTFWLEKGSDTDVPLYASPQPVRTKDLTDDEIEAVINAEDGKHIMRDATELEIVRAGIAADREKNK